MLPMFQITCQTAQHHVKAMTVEKIPPYIKFCGEAFLLRLFYQAPALFKTLLSAALNCRVTAAISAWSSITCSAGDRRCNGGLLKQPGNIRVFIATLSCIRKSARLRAAGIRGKKYVIL